MWCIARSFVLIAAVGLVGCSPEEPEYYGPYKLEKMSRVERADCLMKGGEIYVGGIFPTELCALPTGDVGKSCERAGECEGYCESATQSCSKWHMGSGCYDYLNEDGTAESVCID